MRTRHAVHGIGGAIRENAGITPRGGVQPFTWLWLDG
jgi:hypothetical protein